MRKFFLKIIYSFPALLVFALGACYQGGDDAGLAERITAENIVSHLQELNHIAEDHDGNRAAGTPGYAASLEYVKQQLQSKYILEQQEFSFRYFEELDGSTLHLVYPEEKQYTYNEDFTVVTYSESGSVVDAEIVAIDVVMPPGTEPDSSTSGCQEDDFLKNAESITEGRVALIQRGSCSNSLKAELAEAAGAVGVIIYNEGQEGRQGLGAFTLGTDSEVAIPVVFTTYGVGEELYHLTLQDAVRISMNVAVVNEERKTSNLLAESSAGRQDSIVMIGAHLDSVYTPGINDNGSGVAAVLEIALQMYDRGVPPENRVRFAFWGAEELGLLGSTYYVEQLGEEELQDIGLYLNFDMLGSRNYVRFVYDGDGSESGSVRPKGSEEIEQIFYEYFDKNLLSAESINLSGRSDHTPFERAGVPVGGLFSGANGKKSAQQFLQYGGAQDEPYDPCYHRQCDDIDNINEMVLEQLAKAAAYTVDHFAAAIRDTGKLRNRGAPVRGSKGRISGYSDYIGPLLLR